MNLILFDLDSKRKQWPLELVANEPKLILYILLTLLYVVIIDLCDINHPCDMTLSLIEEQMRTGKFPIII